MTITPDQARSLLDGATDGPWEHEDTPGPGEDPVRSTAVYATYEPGAIAYVQPNAADVALIAAAPDLARTVIEQAEEIAKLQGMISRASCEIDALKNPGIDQ